MSGGARAFGVSVGTFGFSGQPVYTLEDPDGTGETYSVAETFIGATYSQNFSDRFSAGFTAEVISDHLGSTRATGFPLDLRTHFHPLVGEPTIRAAVLIDNLGSHLRHHALPLDTGASRPPPL